MLFKPFFFAVVLLSINCLCWVSEVSCWVLFLDFSLGHLFCHILIHFLPSYFRFLSLLCYRVGFSVKSNHLCPGFVLHRTRIAHKKGYFSSLTDLQTNKQFHFKLTRNEQFFIPVEMAVYPYNREKVKIGSTNRINSLDQTKDFNPCFTSTSFTSSCFEGYNFPFAYMNSAMHIISPANIPEEFNLES